MMADATRRLRGSRMWAATTASTRIALERHLLRVGGRRRWGGTAGLRGAHARAATGAASGDGGDDGVGGGGDGDTIAAVVSGGPQCAVGIVRVSGPEALNVLRAVFRRSASRATASSEWEPMSHRVYHGFVVDPATGRRVDEALAIPMIAPRSYTAEDVVELQTHGGSICTRRVLDCCVSSVAGRVRVARPGEFTLRAFLNGRLDLTQAESVAAVVGARTVEAADAALAGLDGGLRREVEGMRTACIALLARIDAHIDYEDELEPLDRADVATRASLLLASGRKALETSQRGKYTEQGLTMALVGAPNVGKSSLLNALSGADRAIVTPAAGTTRDVVEAHADVFGVPTKLLDTAGIRKEVVDAAEAMGVQRSQAAARAADVVVMVAKAGEGWTAQDASIFQAVRGRGREGGGREGGGEGEGGRITATDGGGSGERAYATQPFVLAFNQVDTLAGGVGGEEAARAMASVPQEVARQLGVGVGAGVGLGGPLGGSGVNADVAADVADAKNDATENSAMDANGSGEGGEGGEGGAPSVVFTSAVTGEGLDALKREVGRLAGIAAGAGAAESGVWQLNTRQAACLRVCCDALGDLVATIEGDWPIDCCAVHLREALGALNELTGSDVTEDVLDSIFSQFCIGK